MRRIVQPSRRARWMRQWDVRDAVSRTRVADRGLEGDFAPEAVDGETAEKKDHPRSEKRELLIEPWPAKRDLGRRRATIAAAGRGLSRKAFRDRGAVRKRVLVDPGLREPASQFRARATAERLTCRQLDRARCLADDRYAIANGSRDDRASALEIARGDAFRAGTDTCVKICEPQIATVAIARRWESFRTSRYRAAQNGALHLAKDAAAGPAVYRRF